MKARVLKTFIDEKEQVKREIGEVIEITKVRFNFANKHLEQFGKGPWLEEVKEQEVEVENIDSVEEIKEVEETPKKKKGKA